MTSKNSRKDRLTPRTTPGCLERKKMYFIYQRSWPNKTPLLNLRKIWTISLFNNWCSRLRRPRSNNFCSTKIISYLIRYNSRFISSISCISRVSRIGPWVRNGMYLFLCRIRIKWIKLIRRSTRWIRVKWVIYKDNN